MPVDDLAGLLAPISIERFFAGHFGRARLVLQGRDPETYAGLPHVDDFEFLLASLTSAQAGWFSVVKVQARRPGDTMLTGDGMLNLSEVFAAYRDGHSLLLNQVQTRHRATGLLTRALETALVERGVLLGRHIGANAYLSPPRSQGFAIHYDPHDVFILQLAGRKTWRIYGQHVRFPTAPPVAPVAPAEAGRPRRVLELAPGDLIYLPRGVLHDANTGDEPSLHLTLSIELLTWRDVLGPLLAAEPLIGQALPPGFGERPGADRRHVAALARQLATSRALPAVTRQVVERLHADLAPLPAGGLGRIDQAGALDADTWLALVPGTLARVHVGNGTARLRLPGASFDGDHHMAPMFRMLASGRPFRARDLPIAVRAKEKLAFVRELYAGGHLVRAPSDRTPGGAARRRSASSRGRARR